MSETALNNLTINNQENKNSRIQKLSPLLINQLSAGEVVTRPASVVKELLENAIDSGATEVKISITQGGMGLIEINDNGKGIHPDDMLMAVTRHATSKIADVEQLYGICTLGFRGEALASISAVSRLTLISSHNHSGVGRYLSVAGQIDEPNITPVVCSQGTTVAVRDLYFNVPARRGNLKSISTEYAHIESVVRYVALVYANIELHLYHEGKCRLNLPAYQTNSLPLTRIKQAISSPLPENAYELFVDLSVLISDSKYCSSAQNQFSSQGHSNSTSSIQGWLWLADELFTNDLPKLIYINNRLVKDTAINLQIRQALQSLNIANNQAGYALFFTLPNEWLNLNVHPSKQRISIHTLANINAHLKNGIQQLLQPIIEKIAVEKNHVEKINTTHIENQKNPNNHQSKSKSIGYPIKANAALNDKYSQVSSPKTVYQVDKDDSEYKNSYLQDNTVLKQSTQKHNQQYKLIIITENQKTRQKAEKLAKIIWQTLASIQLPSKGEELGKDNKTTITKYHELNNSYKIEILFDLDDKISPIEQMIALSDRICAPWTVFYQQETRQIELLFQKSVACGFRDIHFNVINWASFERVEDESYNSDTNK